MDHIRKTYDVLHHLRRKLAIGAVCLASIWVLVHVVSGANGMMVYQQKRVEYRKVEQEIQQLQKENDALTERTRALKSDRDTIEKEAREQLRYAKPGEVIYLLPSQKTPEPPASAAKSGN